MGNNNNTELRDDTEIRFRNIGTIRPDAMVMLSYIPARGKYGPNDRSGVVTHVETREDGLLQFRFDDEDREREIEVVLGPEAGDSYVRSRKNQRWTTLGTPVRISAREDIDELNEMMLKTAEETFECRHESVVAAAEVEWNSQIIEWFTWSDENA